MLEDLGYEQWDEDGDEEPDVALVCVQGGDDAWDFDIDQWFAGDSDVPIVLTSNLPGQFGERGDHPNVIATVDRPFSRVQLGYALAEAGFGEAPEEPLVSVQSVEFVVTDSDVVEDSEVVELDQVVEEAIIVGEESIVEDSLIVDAEQVISEESSRTYELANLARDAGPVPVGPTLAARIALHVDEWAQIEDLSERSERIAEFLIAETKAATEPEDTPDTPFG